MIAFTIYAPFADGDDPWADYTVPLLYEYLSTCKLSRDVGYVFQYPEHQFVGQTVLDDVADAVVERLVADLVERQLVPADVARDHTLGRLLIDAIGSEPYAAASDSEFLRRASLDICGTLPRPDEVRQFSADTSTDKRAKKIDEMLAHKEAELKEI